MEYLYSYRPIGGRPVQLPTNRRNTCTVTDQSERGLLPASSRETCKATGSLRYATSTNMGKLSASQPAVLQRQLTTTSLLSTFRNQTARTTVTGIPKRRVDVACYTAAQYQQPSTKHDMRPLLEPRSYVVFQIIPKNTMCVRVANNNQSTGRSDARRSKIN